MHVHCESESPDTHTLITRGFPTGSQAMCHQNFYVGSHNLLFRTSYHGEQQNGRTGMRLGHTTNSVFGAKQQNYTCTCVLCVLLFILIAYLKKKKNSK